MFSHHLGSAVLGLALLASAQSNGVSGLDLKISDLSTITVHARTGTYPNGVNGLGGATTACNVGTVLVDWYGGMDPRHPFIGTLVARDTGTRFEQISDRSFVKHGYLSLNSSNCGACQNPNNSAVLGVSCSDTYSANLNGNSYYLAPPDEIDPWLCSWNAVGSHFDRGEPDVGPPANSDGVRSLTNAQVTAMGPIAHRMRVLDADFAVSGARFYYQGFYAVRGERDAVRENNFASREFTATWSITNQRWTSTVTGAMTNGSVLTRWSGAVVTSGGNGNDDGRFYVAVKVTGPVAGRYHYEYAIQNRDNVRGGSAFRIPICRDAKVFAAGFRDVDQSAANDWTFTRTPTELAWTTPNAPLRWNSFYNVWFDSDAAPRDATLLVDQYAAGPGLAAVAIQTRTPGELVNLDLGAGCTAAGPLLHATGTPARALLGNTSFGLQMNAVQANASCWFFLSGAPSADPLGSGCTSYVDLALPILSIGVVADASGRAVLPLPVPSSTALEGTVLATQGCQWNPPAGAWYGYLDFSNGLKVRIGNTLPGCP